MIDAILGGLARLLPAAVDPSADLVEALAFLESDSDPETVVRAGYGLGLITVPTVGGALLLVVPWWTATAIALGVGIGLTHAVHVAPRHLATLRRTRALGATPDLVARMVLRMHLEPTTESAVTFAASTGDGPLAASLADHLDRAITTPTVGFRSFAAEWATWFPSLQRSAHLLEAAEEAPPGERARSLDRALDATLSGTRDQMATFTSRIRGPATGLYAFGVMLPLALVALVPAASVAGYSVSVWVFTLLYLGILPTLLLLVGAWLLARRPVAFPPPRVSRSRSWLRPVVAAIAIAVIGWVTLQLTTSGGLALIVAPALGVGTALMLGFRPVAMARARVRDIEDHLPDALYLVGQHVGDGLAVEAAIELAGDRTSGSTGSVFAEAARLQRRLPVDVERAFLGPWGVLEDVPSPRTRGMAQLLATAATEGRPAGLALVRMADHLQELQRLERDTRRDLLTVTGTLNSTATVFAPIVAGSTVALGDAMAGTGVAGTETVAVHSLSIAVAGYVAVLAVVLTTLSIGLRYGLDRPLVGYRVGRALLLAMPLYVTSKLAVGTIV